MSKWLSMPELEDILGRDMAQTLSRYKPGISIYVPKTASSNSELGKILGQRPMLALCEAFGGEWVTIPNGKLEPQKNNVVKLLGQGKTKTEVALACGVTERYVYQLARLFAEDKPKQLTLI